MLRQGSEWTHENLVIKAVPAMTDDYGAMGVVITDESDGKKYYVASDTLYNEDIFPCIPEDIDTLFVPINGEDGSMNVYDAMRFAKVIDAVHTVPVHFGMFDDIDPEIFKCEGRVIPDIYKVIPLVDNERTEHKKLSLKKVFDAEKKEMKELKDDSLNYIVNLECEKYSTVKLIDKLKEDIVTSKSGLYVTNDGYIYKGDKVNNFVSFDNNTETSSNNSLSFEANIIAVGIPFDTSDA
jgi:hypothetical protein